MRSMKHFPEILGKLVAVGSKPTPESFPELLDCVIWIRFFLASSFGLYLGLTAAAGGAYLVYGLNIITFIPILYCQMILLTDMDSYKDLLFAGVFNAMGMLLLTWIFGYSQFFSSEELKVAAALFLQHQQQNLDMSTRVDDAIMTATDSILASAMAGLDGSTSTIADDQEF